jgi:hypothetical protein
LHDVQKKHETYKNAERSNSCPQAPRIVWIDAARKKSDRTWEALEEISREVICCQPCTDVTDPRLDAQPEPSLMLQKKKHEQNQRNRENHAYEKQKRIERQRGKHGFDLNQFSRRGNISREFPIGCWAAPNGWSRSRM